MLGSDRKRKGRRGRNGGWDVQRRAREALDAALARWSEARAGARSVAKRAARSAGSAGEYTAARAREVWARRPTAARPRRLWERRPEIPEGVRDRSLLAAGAAAGALAFAYARRDARIGSWCGRVALVTGGTRGFGLLLARELASDGCSVAICARDETELRRAQEDLLEWGADVLAVRCDVTDQRQVEQMVGRVLERFGRIDVLVNNAGGIGVGPIESATVEDFRHAREVIFDGAVHCVLAVLPKMLERGGGHVINVSSIGGRIAMPHLVPYDSAKFALTGFSEGLRAELAPQGICVTTVFPGTMRTGSYRNAMFKGRRDGEFTWFALASTLPWLSTSAERVARAAIRGAKLGKAEVIVPFHAKVLTLLHGVAPATTGAVAGWLARALPGSPGTDGEAVEGRRVEEGLSSGQRRWLEPMTVLGRRDGRRALPGNGQAGYSRPNVGEAERVLSGAAGGILALGGLRRGGALGLATSALGCYLIARGTTGRCALYRSVGVGAARRRARPDAAHRPPAAVTDVTARMER